MHLTQTDHKGNIFNYHASIRHVIPKQSAARIHISSNITLHSILNDTLDDRRGETYTLCAAETFFGDISGRLGKGVTLGDPGHWADKRDRKIYHWTGHRGK